MVGCAGVRMAWRGKQIVMGRSEEDGDDLGLLMEGCGEEVHHK